MAESEQENGPECRSPAGHAWRIINQDEDEPEAAYISTTPRLVLVEQAVCDHCKILRERFIDFSSPEDPAPYWSTYRFPQVERHRQGGPRH